MAKRLSPFRVPKGVPTEIRRALRLGKPGRFLSTQKALQLYDLLGFQAEQGAKRHSSILAKFETVKRPETKSKYLRLLRASQEEYGGIRHGLNQLAGEFGAEPVPPLAGPDVVPTIPDVGFGGGHGAPEEGALEVEIGVDYLDAEGWHHAGTSDVSFNARLYRRDRRPITESDARAAIFQFADTGHFPRGIEAKTVTWQDYKGVTRSGREHDLENFRGILLRVGDSGLRIGLVKPDEL